MEYLTCAIRTLDGQTIGVLVLQPKAFASGKAGFFGQGKLEVDGVRYQCQTQMVAIGEKAPVQVVAQNGTE